MRTGNLPANMKKARVIQIIPCKAVGMEASGPEPPTFECHAGQQVPLGPVLDTWELYPMPGRKGSSWDPLGNLHRPIWVSGVPRIWLKGKALELYMEGSLEPKKLSSI